MRRPAATKTAVGVAATLALTALAACGSDSGTRSAPPNPASPKAKAQPERIIGDGSTAYTGAQPHQPVPERLKPGQKPPQFVVFSWDGAGEDGQKLFSHFRDVGKKYGATMSYFLSGVYMLPQDRRDVYEPPEHRAGSSDIGFNDTKGIEATLKQMRGAWEDGNEIGTHFNGHFCGPHGGVGTWSSEEWKSEINQAVSFVRHWKSNAGLRGEQPLPFDYAKELVGGRAPCLEGQRNLVPAAKSLGFRYDASSPGGIQVWPSKIDGLWDFPLQEVPVPGRSFETLSMDYNFLANQSPRTTKGDPSKYRAWGDQMRDGLLAGFDRAYHGNRAPLFIGDHFESWNGGTYMRAVEDTIKTVCPKAGVRCVSFKQLADWLDAQDPKVLQRMRTLDVGEAPAGGWKSYLSADALRHTAGSVGAAGAPAAGGQQGTAAQPGLHRRHHAEVRIFGEPPGAHDDGLQNGGAHSGPPAQAAPPVPRTVDGAATDERDHDPGVRRDPGVRGAEGAPAPERGEPPRGRGAEPHASAHASGRAPDSGATPHRGHHAEVRIFGEPADAHGHMDEAGPKP